MYHKFIDSMTNCVGNSIQMSNENEKIIHQHLWYSFNCIFSNQCSLLRSLSILSLKRKTFRVCSQLYMGNEKQNEKIRQKPKLAQSNRWQWIADQVAPGTKSSRNFLITTEWILFPSLNEFICKKNQTKSNHSREDILKETENPLIVRDCEIEFVTITKTLALHWFETKKIRTTRHEREPETISGKSTNRHRKRFTKTANQSKSLNLNGEETKEAKNYCSRSNWNKIEFKNLQNNPIPMKTAWEIKLHQGKYS